MDINVLANFWRKPLLWALAAGLMLGMGFIINAVSPPETIAFGSSSGPEKFPIWFAYLTSYGISMKVFGVQAMISSSLLLGIGCVVVGLLLVGLITKQARNAVYMAGPLIAYALATTSYFAMESRREAVPLNAWPAMFGFIICVVVAGFVVQWILSTQRLISDFDTSTFHSDIFTNKMEKRWSERDQSPSGRQVAAYRDGSNGEAGQTHTFSKDNVAPVSESRPDCTGPNPVYCPFCGRKGKMRTRNGREYSLCCDLPVGSLNAEGECVICGEMLSKTGSYCGACGKIKDIQSVAQGGTGV